MEQLNLLWINTGLYQMAWGQGLMLLVGILLISLAIVKKFEPRYQFKEIPLVFSHINPLIVIIKN